VTVSVVGGVQVDLVMTPVPSFPVPGGSTFVDTMAMRVGGAGANAALALAEIGAPVRLFGCVGGDLFGRWILDELGPDLAREVTVVAGAATGVTVACEAPGRDRSFITHLGVAETCGPAMVPADGLAGSSLLLCDYFCAPALRGAPTAELLRAAREAGVRTLFDTAWDPEGFPPETRREVMDLLPLVDVFLPNEAEACGIAGEADPVAAARHLQGVSGGWVVVKLGAAGCHAAGPGGRELAEPAPVVDVTDTTGAGDAFNAGLVAALAGGQDWREALRGGIALASAVVARPSGSRYTGRNNAQV
jgi:sugar/nucleoside kinase (ribokinase family)